MKTTYELRRAAGVWWLIHTAQRGEPYEKPKMLNDTAAHIAKGLLAGCEKEVLAAELSKTYGISAREALEDIGSMERQLFTE